MVYVNYIYRLSVRAGGTAIQQRLSRELQRQQLRLLIPAERSATCQQETEQDQWVKDP